MRIILLAATAGTVAMAQPAMAQKYNLTIAGYSPGGLVSTVGAGLDAALAAAYPGSTLTYQTSSGGLANAVALDQKKVPLAFISDTELSVAVNGRPPINRKIADLRVLFNPYSPGSRFQATHFLANKAWAEKHGITSVADIAKKKPAMRIAVNRPGNLDGDVSLGVLSAYGITADSIKSAGGQLVRAASQEMTSLMLDRRLDIASFGISINHARIQEMANGLELVLLTIDEPAAKKVSDQLGGKPCSIKAGEYKFAAPDTSSVCVGMSVVVRADLDEKTAYDVTKGVFEQIDKYRAAHRLLQKAVTPASLAEAGQVPFHLAAEKYLREKGLRK
ncbi:MAG: TAXI family TRAP transporter solute-binding subunit [Alphaproteobacteria bacterium]|nr:TAXI family TRAP transporter solute-binding subunit [Alphaproteobacteria bacterium]